MKIYILNYLLVAILLIPALTFAEGTRRSVVKISQAFRFHYGRALGRVACATKNLKIGRIIEARSAQGNDVIYNQALRCSAVFACGGFSHNGFDSRHAEGMEADSRAQVLENLLPGAFQLRYPSVLNQVKIEVPRARTTRNPFNTDICHTFGKLSCIKGFPLC